MSDPKPLATLRSRSPRGHRPTLRTTLVPRLTGPLMQRARGLAFPFVGAVLIAPAVAAQDIQVLFGGAFAPVPAAAHAAGPGSGSSRQPGAPGVPGVVFSNLPGSTTAAVPGLGGVSFEPGAGTNHFDRIYGHADGHWVLTALADLPAARNECLIADGQLVIQEGSAAPWTGGAENCGTMDTRCSINAAGDIAFATNTSASSLDDYVAARIGGVWSYAAREGDAVPGLAGGMLDDSIDTCVLLDDGRVGYSADGIDGAVTTDVDDDVLVLGNLLLMQKGVTSPSGQAGAATLPMENFDLNDFWASADGAHWVVQGDLEGATSSDDVVVVDGAVALQEGSVIPGSGFTEPIDTNGIFGVSMDSAGRWFARGDNDQTNQDWVVRDGTVIALGGDTIVPGSSEVWDDAAFSNGFFAQTGNSLGDFVVGGTTSEADTGRDAVLVLNGQTIVARESDPVDLDGNGLLDDGLFIDAFGDDDLFLTNDLDLLTVVTLKDASGQRVGQALILLPLDPGVGTGFCDAVPNSTGAPGRLTAMGSAAVASNDLRLVARDLPPRTFAFFIAGTGRALIPGVAGSQGTYCLSGNVGRFLDPGDIKLTALDGLAQLAVDLARIPTQTSTTQGLPGDTFTFQCWYRDRLPNGEKTSNLTSAVEVTLR